LVPGLNELQEKYGEQGLIIVGVTNEAANLVDRSISSQHHAYPIAMVRGGAADSAYGVRGFPTVVLVGPDGTVISKDRHPEREIVKALENVVLVPLLDGRKYASINKSIKNKDLGKAWKAVTRMLSGSPEDSALVAARDAIEKSFAHSFSAAVKGAEAGSYGAALENLEKLAARFKGYTRAAEATDKAKEIKNNPSAADDLKAHAMLKKAKKEFNKGKKASREKARGICKKIIKSYPDTPTAEKARNMLG